MNSKVLVKPPVEEMYLNNKYNEKAVYIKLPEKYEEYSLEADIKNGGIQYSRLTKVLQKRNISRVITLSSDTVEMGIIAVSYLAMKLAKRQGGYEENPEWEAVSGCLWTESDRKIPIITISELSANMRRSEYPFEENGFLVAQAQPYERRKPYWFECKSKAVCVIVERNFVDSTNLKYINLFAANKNVYVIFVDRKSYEEEFEVDMPFGCMDSEHFLALRNNFILVNASDAVDISFGSNDDSLYYKNIFKQNMKQRNIKLKKGFLYERVINLAKSVNEASVCDMLDRIINYAVKDMDGYGMDSIGNREFDFVDHFMRNKGALDGKENGRALMEKELVGMEEIKQQVYDVVNVMKYNKIRTQMNIKGSSFHNVHVMLGAPGTAKTTVARYMGQMMFDEKLLSDNRYICINGAELKGKYVGHSAPNTKKLFESYDVIIIDEAYSIVEESGTTDSFGNEAIAQLIIELENHSTDKLVIFAGYGGEVDEKDNRMKTFLDSNPGIKSRITSTFYFKAYSAKEMVQIFRRIAQNSSYVIPADEEEQVDELIEHFFEARLSMRNFGNGREARVLLETAVIYAARRNMELNKEKYTRKDMQTLTISDIKSAIEKLEKDYGKNKGINKSIGFTQ